jgi:hypothetical protein
MAKNQKKLAQQEAAQAVARIVDGKLWTEFGGRALVLHRLTAAQANRLTLVYHREVARLTAEGELLSEALLDGLVAQRAKAAGIDPRALDPEVRQEVLRRVYAVVPEAFGAQGEAAIAAKAKAVGDAFTPEEVVILEAMAAVDRLKASLEGATVETAARALQLQHELWTVARGEEDAPFWPSLEAMLAEPDDAFRDLLGQYRAWKAGAGPDFFSRLPGRRPGKAAGA